MPLTAKSSGYLHILQNLSLLAVALSFSPLSTGILLTSFAISLKRWLATQTARRSSTPPSPCPKTILVTGVGMSKGLFIARAFHRCGHVVIGADFEPLNIPVCGRFSAALKKFYRLPSPASRKGRYMIKLLEIIKEERVDLWISCSGVMSAIEDGEAADAVESHTDCRAIQFGAGMTQILHEKHSFVENTNSLGLNVPETRLVTSVDAAMEVLDYPSQGMRYILKCVGVEDSVRADMTLLPLYSSSVTRKHILKLKPSHCRPFVLQQYISGPEYCTHAIIVRGQVAAFTACKSAELLMHYEPLSKQNELFAAMLDYTEAYVQQMGSEMTGHFSLDFLVDETDPGREIGKKMFPIECNPRAHTAVVNFGADIEGMVNGYLRVLSHSKDSGIFISSSTTKHYWVGHDLVTRVCLPVVAFCTGRSSLSCMLESWLEFAEHVAFWRDPTYEIEDPWPAWWLYCVYWPCNFVMAIFKQRWWSRCNVSTGKVFQC